ncbi:immunity protein Imm33 domain-containing protein [Fundicoccus culcitae]|uniref:DUF2185 domain-containing protein n=1 Tax=Fundicoccus culcitae TaxID=2969821 RepID=A0ABY5P9C3_9LACT|nr:DUF2185 domain-containing protein [Fundicoccus culcitae]UUX35129.1 DUF2185 domain-containing protein [Fundicoccus culcitae]
MEENYTIFIENAGGMMVTRSLLEGTSKLKWIFRSESQHPDDNGWRALGDTDTEEYINVVENNVIIDFNRLATMEPAVLSIYQLPVGTDLVFHDDETGRYFTDIRTGERLRFEK